MRKARKAEPIDTFKPEDARSGRGRNYVYVGSSGNMYMLKRGGDRYHWSMMNQKGFRLSGGSWANIEDAIKHVMSEFDGEVYEFQSFADLRNNLHKTSP